MHECLEGEEGIGKRTNRMQKEIRGMEDYLIADKIVLQGFKQRRTNLAILWVGDRKKCDIVPRW